MPGSMDPDESDESVVGSSRVGDHNTAQSGLGGDLDPLGEVRRRPDLDAGIATRVADPQPAWNAFGGLDREVVWPPGRAAPEVAGLPMLGQGGIRIAFGGRDEREAQSIGFNKARLFPLILTPGPVAKLSVSEIDCSMSFLIIF